MHPINHILTKFNLILIKHSRFLRNKQRLEQAQIKLDELNSTSSNTPQGIAKQKMGELLPPQTGPLDNVCAGHFEAPKNEQARQDIFSKYVKFIEVEIFSFCNRRCSFCPNYKLANRHSSNIFMPEETYLSILEQLKQMNYSGNFLFHRYNEPLADKIILKRVAQAREYLPKAFLHIVSNGDYATPELLSQLEQAGLDMLSISAYLPEGTIPNKDVVHKRIQEIESRLSLNCDWENEYDGANAAKFSKLNTLNIDIRFGDMSIIGSDRGGLLDVHLVERTEPCLRPFHFFFVDYDGSVVPCCNIRSDMEEHKPYVWGNINTATITDIFFSETAAKWRRHLIHYGIKKNKPCTNCADFFNWTKEPGYSKGVDRILSLSAQDIKAIQNL